ncbi:MAG: DUF3298 domain-containing protein [Crocinitomicaceae bacterium]|nr:DUF3298 domain-containing protein [Crocinitomicaceae bacterium]
MLKRLSSIGMLLFVLLSCFVSKEGRSQVSNEQIISGVVIFHLVSSDKQDTSFLRLDYDYYNPEVEGFGTANSAYKDSVNALIYDDVFEITAGWTAGERTKLTKEFFKARLDSFALLYEEYKDIDEYRVLFELEGNYSIHEFSSYVEISIWGWSFSGGAHGNGYNVTTMINKSDGRTLKLEDFVSDVDQLNVIAEPLFREMFDLRPEQSLSDYGFEFVDDQFSINDNFTFSENYVHFYYNTYEIAPYAGGPTELVIPIADIKHLIKLKK